MADMMTFPETWEEFEELYGFYDSEKVYTNGSRLIQSFRVEQWLDHIKAKKEKEEGRMMVSPETCGDSIQVGTTYICRIVTAPCSLYSVQSCVRDESEKRIKEALKND